MNKFNFIIILLVFYSCNKKIDNNSQLDVTTVNYNYEGTKIDSIYIEICNDFITESVRKNVWLEHVENKQDTLLFRVFQINNSIHKKSLPYKIFYIKNKWCLISKKNEENNERKTIDFLSKIKINISNYDDWPLFSEKNWYVRIYMNEDSKKYDYSLDPIY